MIQDLKNEDIINKVGGRFRLTALIQKRWKQLMMGARPLIEPGRMTPMEIAIREIIEGKIAYNDAEDGGGEQDA
ncbi:DNA-directed RNA polymerase subunit omega [Phycisphaerae bacterium RAS2]|nr:DNA-directed RNA polymerase subunit omega [Phycisphaerae bacterium RAS2]